MNTPSTCVTCGSALPNRAAQCPRCAFDLATQVESKAQSGIELPRSFGNYDLLEVIGEGGSGVVYKARDRVLRRTVAIKMLRSGLLATWNELKRFEEEARTVAGLKHPNLVPIFEVGCEEGRVFYAMEYIAGARLSPLISPRAAARQVGTMAQTMQHAHERGVLHRDLKPANILIDERGEPRIADFGLARDAQREASLTDSGAVLGTPSYMPPEQAAGSGKDVCPKSDVYSLGAILYYLLTGEPPFRGATLGDTVRQVLDSEPVPPRQRNREIPKDLETICLKCLRKKPDQRYGSAQELAQDLERFLAREPIHARPVTRFERLTRWCQRNPGVAIALAAITTLLSLLAVAALLFWGDTRETSELLALSVRAEVQEGLNKLYPVVANVATAPELSTMLSQSNKAGLEAVLGTTLARKAREAPAWLRVQNWLVLDANGQPFARWPTNVVRADRSSRDYFQRPGRHQNERPARPWVSKVFQSDDDGHFKFAVSQQVLGPAGESLGVLALMVDTLNFANALGPVTDQRKIALVGEWDGSSRYSLTNVAARWKPFEKRWPRATSHVLLMHPEFGTNNLVLPLKASVVATCFSQAPDHPSRPASSSRGYRDPVAAVDWRYRGAWIVGVAPVPETPLTVVYQTRDRFADALLTAVGAAFAVGAVLGGARLWLRARKRSSD